MATASPDKIGKYEIRGQIGRGSTASVYLSRDDFHHRDIALKVAHPEILRHPKRGKHFRNLFFREAKIAGLLKHPNVVAVHDAGIEEDSCFIAMEYIDNGSTLEKYTRQDRQLPIHDVVQLIFTCARVLDHAHRLGVVHRDLKPANIMLTKNHDVKIVDFGIALMTKSDAVDAQLKEWMGSPRYMSPEQITRSHVSNQSDIFSLGVVFYELLTGRPPFQGDRLPALSHAITQTDPEPVTSFRGDVPQVLNQIIRRALQKKTQKRYQSAMDFAGDLSLVFDELTFDQQELSESEKFELILDLTFFSDFSRSELGEAIRVGTFLESDAGELLIGEGDEENSFYIVLSGKVMVVKNSRKIATLWRGECFGEMGFVTNEPRTASVFADSSVWLMKVSQTQTERTSAECQLRIQRAIMRTLSDRLRDLTIRV